MRLHQMTCFSIVAAVALLLCIPSGAQKHSLVGNYFLWHDTWQSPPPEAGIPNQQWAFARLIHFANDGQFEMIGCIILRVNGEVIGISNGDYPSGWLGHYKAKGNLAPVTYRMVMVLDGPILPESEKTDVAFYQDGTLEFAGLKYEKTESKALTEGMVEWVADAKAYSKKPKA